MRHLLIPPIGGAELPRVIAGMLIPTSPQLATRSVNLQRTFLLLERLAGDGFRTEQKKMPITIRLKSVETFSGVSALPIPHG